MAQTGYTPILIYSSSTTTNAPTAGNLTNSTLGSELAINITDGKLFYKDNANVIQVIAWKTTPTTAGGTGLTSYTAGDTLYYATGTTLSKLAIGASKTIMTSSGTAPQWSASLDTTQGGTGLTSYTAGDLIYYATGTALTKLAIGASTTILTSSGSAPQWTAASSVSIGTATNLAGGAAGSVPYQTAASTTSMLAIGTAYYMLGVNSGATAPSWQPSATSVLTTQGDLLYASAANTLARLAKNTSATRYLANSGTSNNPAWAQVDLTNGVTGVLPVANGGTNASSASITAFNNITGYTALGATGTTSTNLVFSGSPTITTPTLSGSSAIGATINGGINAGFIEYKGLNTGAEWLVGPLNLTNAFEWKNNTSDKYLLNLSNTGNLKIYEGNLVIGTSGKGIDFSANSHAAGMTSELLDWYEEGTWTPTLLCTDGAFTSVTYDPLRGGSYTRVGNVVHLQCYMRTDAVNNTVGRTADVIIGGVPFAAVSGTGGTLDGHCSLAVSVSSAWAGEEPLAAFISGGDTNIQLLYRTAVDGNTANNVAADVGTGANANIVLIGGTYICA